ncbi:DNA polymerase Y family protein [Corticibacter populi]|uniref:DNA polymerase Y family protein n=1 Tax=Corticibacter populi TaxID=1550736 RepID=A0A3M6QYB8_9BURK|nr:DNA polymerase Y family protein [Corticibacter populi]RMX07921.1 DNA polymerase Y family protein [Corticibacter populi]RZS35160.1 protein ImuB [Corticibacter populi]
MLWACIALPQLALDGVLRRHEAPEQPLALVGGHPQRRELLAVNAAAQRLGLRAGQRLTLAQAITPAFGTIAHDPSESLRWQQLLATWACRYSGQVHAGWADALVLEAGSSLKLMGGWESFEQRLRQDLRALQFQHRIALAPTPRAAHVLARLRDGIRLFDSQAMRQVLEQVPVRRAALPGDAGERLHRLGVRHLQQLFAMPRDGLRRRFGLELLEHLDRLLGLAPEPLEHFEPPARFDLRIELAFHVENHMPLLFPVRRLIADLATFAASRGAGVQRFALLLEHDDEHPATRVEIGMLTAERDAALLFELARTRLEQVELPMPVVALRLLATQLPPFVPAGRDLFDERPAGTMPWEQLRERLRARLGEEALYQIEPVADPRPEHAWHRCMAATGAGSGASAIDWPLRPNWLLPEPQPLHDPALRILAGPERLESGWWDGDDARRDYYVLETSGGQRAWAFTPVGRRGPWMLHGWFA